MKIVIAAWHLEDFNVGLGRYARELVEAIGRVDRTNQYDILMPEDGYQFPARPNMRYRLVRVPFFKRRVWEQVAPVLAREYDLLHFPYDSCVAWKRAKFVVTIHDVKPLVLGGARQSRNLNSLVQRAIVGDPWRKIDHVLTDSECSRQDIVKHLGVLPERITVVYPGVDAQQFRPAPRRSPEAGSRPYVLCVAGADPTKNVETLIDAFARLPMGLRNAHDLKLVGDFRRREDVRSRVSQLGLEKQTNFPGVVSDERLVALYQGATAFVFPSRYEGFGLPVLEAMACGCPVISSNASSLPEVAGQAAVLVDPSDVNGFTGALEEVLADPTLRRRLSEGGLAQAARFSWDRTAEQTIAVYQKVVQG